jgi:hypothetical protein
MNDGALQAKCAALDAPRFAKQEPKWLRRSPKEGYG